MIKNQCAEKPLKSMEIGLYQINEILKSDGSDGFSGPAKITAPAAPVASFISFLR